MTDSTSTTPENVPNALVQVLDGRKRLLADLSGVPEDTLRLALAQVIEGLERLDEFAEEIADVARHWRQAEDDPTRLKRSDERVKDLAINPVEVAGQVDWLGAHWVNDKRQVVPVSAMTRAEVEAGLVQAWGFVRRMGTLAHLLGRDSKALMAGGLLVAVSSVPDPDEDAPTRAAARPRA